MWWSIVLELFEEADSRHQTPNKRFISVLFYVIIHNPVLHGLWSHPVIKRPTVLAWIFFARRVRHFLRSSNPVKNCLSTLNFFRLHLFFSDPQIMKKCDVHLQASTWFLFFHRGLHLLATAVWQGVPYIYAVVFLELHIALLMLIFLCLISALTGRWAKTS